MPLLNPEELLTRAQSRIVRTPFWHAIVDDFLPEAITATLAQEFPAYDDACWYGYQNALEDKKALNDWNRYPPTTYRLFSELNSPAIVAAFSRLVGTELHPDHGLHGGGWHIHARGGKLNPHLDYSMHPKLGLQRKLNLIVYLSQPWDDAWGGHFGLWSHNADTQQPAALIDEVPIRFNRAVLFDTTQNSWHGISRPVTAPTGCFRKSLAAYYLCAAPPEVDGRARVLFAPTPEQVGDSQIQELIKMRSDVARSQQVYRQK